MAKIAGIDAFHPFVCGLVDADEVEVVEVEAEEAEEHDEAVQDEHHGAQPIQNQKATSSMPNPTKATMYTKRQQCVIVMQAQPP